MKNGIHFLDATPEAALFSTENGLDGIVVLVFQNERPLAGLSGLLDWRLNGMISSLVREGRIDGKKGECTYLPIKKPQRTLHLILLGAGQANPPGTRGPAPPESVHILKKNLGAFQSILLGLSRNDFGNPPDDYFLNMLKGQKLCIVQ